MEGLPGGSIFEELEASQPRKIEQLEQYRKEAILNDKEDGRLTRADWLVLTANLAKEKLRFALEEWRHMLLQQAQKPFWKDPLYTKDYAHKPLPFGMLTDDDIQDIIMSQQEAKRCGDPWCTPSFFYWYVSIPDKMAHPPPEGGYTDEHEKWVQTPFNGSQKDDKIKGRGEEITVPWNLVSKRVRPVAVVKYVLANKEERQAGDFICEKGLPDKFVDDFLFAKKSKYRKDVLDSRQWACLKAGVEQEGPCGAYLSGSDRGKGAKRTGGMDLVPDLVKQAKTLEDQEWKPVLLNAWRLLDSECADSASLADKYDYEKFKVGAMFENKFDLETGRAASGSTVMAAHGVHPVYLRQMLEVGLNKGAFKERSCKVPSFKSQKQFMTLGEGFYTTTQMSKASQYSPAVNDAWVRYDKVGEDVMEAWDFDAYERKHDECWGPEYPKSMMRKSPVYLLIVEVDVELIFPLYAGTPDLQKPNVPMLEWALHYQQHQETYRAEWNKARLEEQKLLSAAGQFFPGFQYKN